MRIIIKTIDGHKENMNIDSKWTVGHLKNEIEKIMEIPVIIQRLIYQGYPLVDEMSLNRVEDGSVGYVK
jgi:hypothetical protein